MLAPIWKTVMTQVTSNDENYGAVNLNEKNIKNDIKDMAT